MLCCVQLILLGGLFFSKGKQEEWVWGRGEAGGERTRSGGRRNYGRDVICGKQDASMQASKKVCNHIYYESGYKTNRWSIGVHFFNQSNLDAACVIRKDLFVCLVLKGKKLPKQHLLWKCHWCEETKPEYSWRTEQPSFSQRWFSRKSKIWILSWKPRQWKDICTALQGAHCNSGRSAKTPSLQDSAACPPQPWCEPRYVTFHPAKTRTSNAHYSTSPQPNKDIITAAGVQTNR